MKKEGTESIVGETNPHGPSGVCECGNPAEPHLVGLRGRLPEDQADEVREWIWVLTQLVEAGKSPQAIIAVDNVGEFVEIVSGVLVHDVPAFLRDAADAVDEPEQSCFMDVARQ